MGGMSERARALARTLGRYKYALGVLLLGVLLMLSGHRSGSESAPAEQPPAYDRAAVQREMEAALAAIDGVGRLRLVLSTDGSEERELARDASLSYEGSSAAPTDYEKRSETVVLGSGSGASVVVTREVYPRVTGALVVCEGAGSAEVRLAVTQAVSALTGLTSDKIAVVRGSPTE